MAYPPPPYADAVCGGFVCGEAICGTWWAYPANAGLGLGGYGVELVVVTGDQVPIAGLALGAFPVELVIEFPALEPQPAGLALGAVTPSFSLSAAYQITAAGLALGGIIPRAVGALWITPDDCIDFVLAPIAPNTLATMAPASESDLVLTTVECR